MCICIIFIILYYIYISINSKIYILYSVNPGIFHNNTISIILLIIITFVIKQLLGYFELFEIGIDIKVQDISFE